MRPSFEPLFILLLLMVSLPQARPSGGRNPSAAETDQRHSRHLASNSRPAGSGPGERRR